MMTTHIRIVLMALLFSLMASSANAETDSDPQALARQVAAIENAFAATMANRDLAAFGEFIAEDSVFISADTPLRGKAAVVAAWSRYFEAEAAPFSWRSGTVQVLASGDLALSRGPVFAADGTQIGNFNSTWQRQADGSWKIIFDHGSDHCPIAGAE